MINWEIGQEIVCVLKDKLNALVLDKIYTIRGIQEGCKHVPVVVNVGIPMPKGMHSSGCPVCMRSISDSYVWYPTAHFSPLADISELESILNEESEYV